MSEAISLHRQYLAGDFSLVDRLSQHLTAVQAHSHLNAFVRLFPETSREQAEQIDRRRADGQPLGLLAGLIVAIKDNLNYKGQPLTCASKILEGYRAPYHAAVVERLLAEDALIIGQTNMDEFAMGSSTENTIYGPAINPHDAQRVAGGSSGGSAAAVAAGLVDLALGSDTGGSIRQPAAFCGAVGLKPSYGRVSRYGLAAYASSLDQIGPIGKSVADVALALKVIAGADRRDATATAQPVDDYPAKLSEQPGKTPTIGLPRQFFQDGLDPQINAAIEQLCDRLKQQGVSFREIDLPLSDYAIACYYLIAVAEASSNLARYDGVRYGYRAEAGDLENMYIRTRSEGFGDEVKQRIILGTYVLSSGYYDAYYRKAQQVRRLIKEEYQQAFAEVDLLLTPTTPTAAFRLQEKLDDPLQMYLSDIYTVTANLIGGCAISVPCGTTKEGLPIGVQLIGPPFRESDLLQGAALIERTLHAF